MQGWTRSWQGDSGSLYLWRAVSLQVPRTASRQADCSVTLQAHEQQLREREACIQAEEHRVELLRVRLENDASATQRAAEAAEAERAELQVGTLRLGARLLAPC